MRRIVGGVALGVILTLALQQGVSLAPFARAREYLHTDPRIAWTAEQFDQWYQRFIQARDEAVHTDVSAVDFAKYQRVVRFAEASNAPIPNAMKFGIDLEKANLQGADLHGVNLERANLNDADLSGAILVGANLQGASLERARLAGTDLRNAQLAFARLVGADLYQADLRGADLDGAKVIGFEVSSPRLTGAIYDGATRLPDATDPQEEGMIRVE